MNENVEDLYLKGFMAYSAKNFAEAKKHWEKVLAMEPTHPKATQGLLDLAKHMPKKRTSKEILQEIKALYAAKKYPEALKLCELLIKKYPSNQDLVGLYRKIANRIQSSGGAAGAGDGSGDFENTIYFQKKAEEFVSSQAEQEKQGQPKADAAQHVETLIQQGVAEYEAGTLKKALDSWQKALALDPANRIAKDYIANVKAAIAKQAQPAAPKPKSARPSKEKLLEAYNQGLKFYQQKSYESALEKWNFILKFHPNHKETLQCLQKTQAALDKNKQYLARLEEARNEVASGNHVGAQSILMQLSIEAPDLEGLQQLKESLEERQQQINEIRSLELETEEPQESSFSPTDDEITQYFTPDEGNASGARQVTRVIVPKKEKKPFNKLLAVGILFGIAALSAGGFFGWQTYQKRQQQARTDTFVMPTVEINWNSDWQRAEDFSRLGNDFSNEGEFLLASVAYERAAFLVKGRIDELQGSSEETLAYDKESELTALKRVQNDIASQMAQNEKELAKASAPQQPDAKAREKADAAIRAGRYDEALDGLSQLFAANKDDQGVRQKLGDLYNQKALEKLGQAQLHEASLLFKKAAVLQPAYETSRQHIEVIQRYFDGRISEVDKDQWFFFFLD